LKLLAAPLANRDQMDHGLAAGDGALEARGVRHVTFDELDVPGAQPLRLRRIPNDRPHVLVRRTDGVDDVTAHKPGGAGYERRSHYT
jgi:hypothetical protein